MIACPLAQRELGLVTGELEKLGKPARSKRIPLDELPIEPVASWACENADYALRLASGFADRLEHHGLSKLYSEVELPLAQQLSELELNGVLIDADRPELGRECNAEIKRLEQEAQRIAGREFNLNSPLKLETLLFDELGLKPIQAHQNLALHRRRHARGAQRQARATARNSGATPGQQAQGHLHRRAARTAQPQDRARPQPGSKPWPPPAGSSTDPNLQNIPIRTELGRKIRAFVAAPGHELVSADYSQIELRVLAHLSQDPVLCESFRTGEDVHLRTAMESSRSRRRTSRARCVPRPRR